MRLFCRSSRSRPGAPCFKLTALGLPPWERGHPARHPRSARVPPRAGCPRSQERSSAITGRGLWLLAALLALLAGCARNGGPRTAATPPPLSIPRFADAAARLGVRFAYDNGGSGRYYYAEVIGGGGALFDFDDDGWLDVYLVQGAALPGHSRAADLRNRLYRNLGGRGFQDVTVSAGVDGMQDGRKMYGIGCCVGDYDNDEHMDLFVTGFGGCLLYRNKGDGTFVDVTRRAGVLTSGFSSSAAFFDYDRDGRLDLFVCQYVRYRLGDDLQCATTGNQRDYCQPGFFPPTRSRLYRNFGGGRFRDVTETAGITSDYNKALGVVAGDFDGDGDPDLYVTCDLTPNLLYVNQGNGTFREEGVTRGCALGENGQPQAGMGVDARDVDGDGRPEILVTNYWAENNNLYRNLEGGLFSDVSSAVGLAAPSLDRVGFGAGLRDLNNDGWLDIFVTNGHVLAHPDDVTPDTPRAQKGQLFLNSGGGQFRDVTARAGSGLAQPRVGRGAAFGDWDNDGDLDILLGPNHGPAAMLVNEGVPGSHWLQLRLRGRRSNRDGIGARIDVTVGGRTQRDEVRSAYSYCSASDLRAHFGLGAVARADRVEVRWPSGQVDRFTQVAADRQYVVTEGAGMR
jgi:enediyne biosynthesis protein E4